MCALSNWASLGLETSQVFDDDCLQPGLAFLDHHQRYRT